jgi:SlyX protein
MTPEASTEDKLVDLECRFAFLEQTLETLNEVAQGQSMVIDQLVHKVDELMNTVREGRPGPGSDASQEPPPPHH